MKVTIKNDLSKEGEREGREQWRVTLCQRLLVSRDTDL